MTADPPRPSRPLLGVSLKMYFGPARTLEWCRAVADVARVHPGVASGAVELLVLPSFVSLPAALEAFAGTGVAVGAQDLFWEDSGPFTGEVSGSDLAALGCAYAEVGHAERRALLGEDDAMIGSKLAAAVRNGLVPVLCVGERTEAGPAAAAHECVDTLESIVGASGLEEAPEIVVAYEPVWAIGAERPAGREHVVAVARVIRDWLAERSPFAAARVIYGGSAGPGTLTELGDVVDGLFLGRFAHDPLALSGMLDESLSRVGPRLEDDRAR